MTEQKASEKLWIFCKIFWWNKWYFDKDAHLWWKMSLSHETRKSSIPIFSRKIKYTVFWDCQRILLLKVVVTTIMQNKRWPMESWRITAMSRLWHNLHTGAPQNNFSKSTLVISIHSVFCVELILCIYVLKKFLGSQEFKGEYPEQFMSQVTEIIVKIW